MLRHEMTAVQALVEVRIEVEINLISFISEIYLGSKKQRRSSE